MREQCPRCHFFVDHDGREPGCTEKSCHYGERPSRHERPSPERRGGAVGAVTGRSSASGATSEQLPGERVEPVVRCCGNCSAFHPRREGDTQGACRAGPPIPLVVGMERIQMPVIKMPDGQSGGGATMRPIVQAAFPVVGVGDSCRDGWRQR